MKPKNVSLPHIEGWSSWHSSPVNVRLNFNVFYNIFVLLRATVKVVVQIIQYSITIKAVTCTVAMGILFS